MNPRAGALRISFPLRVNNLKFRDVSLRPSGASRQDFDVVVHDIRIGSFALHDEFVLEVPSSDFTHWQQLSFRELKAAILEAVRTYAYDLGQLAFPAEAIPDAAKDSTSGPIPRLPIDGDSSHIGRASHALNQAGIRFEIVGGLGRSGQIRGHLTLAVSSVLDARMCLGRAGFLETGESRCVLMDSTSGWKVQLLSRGPRTNF